MGGGKAVLELHGTPLVVRAVGMIHAHCTEIVVVGRVGAPLPDGLSVPVVYDQPGRAGPVAGIAAGLAALAAEDVLIFACDLPLAGPALARLADHAPGRAVVVVTGDGVQPLCARVPRHAALAAAERLLEGETPSARALIEALCADVVACPDAWLANVNTPSDARRAEAALALDGDGAESLGDTRSSLS
jgi:molybdopterin-guanine dinucleotide biosynthesis protein A